MSEYFISTREQALARINEIDKEIIALRAEQERLAREHSLVITRGDYGAGETFYPTMQSYMKENGWTASEVSDYTGYKETSFPRWISSSENC
jgi:hypothetical protein